MYYICIICVLYVFLLALSCFSWVFCVRGDFCLCFCWLFLAFLGFFASAAIFAAKALLLAQFGRGGDALPDLCRRLDAFPDLSQEEANRFQQHAATTLARLSVDDITLELFDIFAPA